MSLSKRISRHFAIVAVSALVATTAMNQSAKSDPVWNVGGSATVNGTNAPSNFSNSVALTLGTVSLDGGAVSLTSSIVPVAGGAEWLILHFSSGTDVPIVGNVNGAWELQALEPLSAPANGLGFYIDWSSNGNLLTPTQSFGPASPGTNPVTGSGTVLVSMGLCPYASCGYINTTTNLVDFFASTSDYAGAPGNNGSAFLTANDFEIGIELQPLATPLPPALPLFATGLGALGLLGWRRKKNVMALSA